MLEKLVLIAPEDFDSYLALASVNKESGKSVLSEYITKARQFIPADDFYNLACLESICDNVDLALEYLEKASKLEQFNPAWTWDDPDLQWIREESRFTKIVGPRPK